MLRRGRAPLRYCRVQILLIAAFAAACRAQRQEPALETGRLAESLYAGGADCARTPRLRVHAYNLDFFVIRQAACANYEEPFLYLIVGTARALLFYTGAGKVDVQT